MADAGGSYLNIGAQAEKQGRGRPRGSKNISKDPAAVASSFVPVKRWWRGVDDVNDRPVGNPKRRCDEHSSKFSLSYETKVNQSSRKKPNSRR
jgi:hypothetical protein